MENTAIIALSRQGALGRQLNVLANNIANMNTSGFKGERMMFVEHLQRNQGGKAASAGPISYVRDIATRRDTTEGPLEKTGNPLDVAIRDKGYFVVDTPEGPRYTRNGHFRLDPEGQLVTQQGHGVLSKEGTPFFLSPGDTRIQISRDGTVSSQIGELGQIRVVEFADEQEPEPGAGGLLKSAQIPTDQERPVIIQGMLEGSNVEPILEMTRIIQVQRAYDGVRKFIDREDQRIRAMIEEYGRPV